MVGASSLNLDLDIHTDQGFGLEQPGREQSPPVTALVGDESASGHLV